jgi:biopolymer transport protein ExbD
MQPALRYRDEPTFMEINTTPLIDVLLVLLIMFIITIPIQTHAVKLDLPGPPEVTDYPPPDPIKNRVVITQAGQILWNGAPISMAGLRHNLVLTQRMEPVPELHLQPDALARYELVDEVLAVTKQSGVANMGLVGNERYATF